MGRTQKCSNARRPHDAPTLGGYALFLTPFEVIWTEPRTCTNRQCRPRRQKPRQLRLLPVHCAARHGLSPGHVNKPSTSTPRRTHTRRLRPLPHTVRGDADQAQNMYQQAINADPSNARNLHYANFTSRPRRHGPGRSRCACRPSPQTLPMPPSSATA